MTVGNATDAVHGFSIEGYGIQEEIQPGAALELEFTATNAGTYKVYCQLHEGSQDGHPHRRDRPGRDTPDPR